MCEHSSSQIPISRREILFFIFFYYQTGVHVRELLKQCRERGLIYFLMSWLCIYVSVAHNEYINENKWEYINENNSNLENNQNEIHYNKLPSSLLMWFVNCILITLSAGVNKSASRDLQHTFQNLRNVKFNTNQLGFLLCQTQQSKRKTFEINSGFQVLKTVTGTYWYFTE